MPSHSSPDGGLEEIACQDTTGQGPIYLWRETHPVYGWLSQWYERPFHAGDGETVYLTAEQ